MGRSCEECKFYQTLNRHIGDCTANVPMWVPSYIVRDDSVVRANSPAEDCNCFQVKGVVE